MKTIYGYFFLKLYNMMLRTPGKKTADHSAIILICLTLFFFTLPFLFLLLEKVSKETNFGFWVIASLGLLYAYFLFKINEYYFIRKGELNRAIQKFKSESYVMSVVGYTLVIGVCLFSFVAFFLLLKLLLP